MLTFSGNFINLQTRFFGRKTAELGSSGVRVRNPAEPEVSRGGRSGSAPVRGGPLSKRRKRGVQAPRQLRLQVGRGRSPGSWLRLNLQPR